MNGRHGILVTFAGALLLFLGGCVTHSRLASILSLQGEIDQKRRAVDSEPAPDFRNASMDDMKRYTEEMESYQARQRELRDKLESETKPLQDKLREARTSYLTGYSTMHYLKCLGALVMAAGLLLLCLKGNPSERAAAILITALVLPNAVEGGFMDALFSSVLK